LFLEQDPTFPSTFLILKLFYLDVYLLGLEMGFGLGSIYLINGSKLAYFLEESSMSMNFLAPESSHIMALKIKDYIISSLLSAHHYLRLIVDDHCYSGPLLFTVAS
jgi:hypothetical protein